MNAPSGDAETDVAVIGGGPAGAATAVALATTGISVALIECGRYVDWKIGEGLPPACKPILRQLGLWDRFRESAHVPSYGNASIWGRAERAEQSFLFDANGPGWHLDRRRFDAMIADAAVAAGAIRYTGMAILPVRRAAQGGWDLHIQADRDEPLSLRAPFVVDASGRSSWFATRHGARRINDDGLVAVVARLVTDHDVGDQDASTFVEAVRDGWWYAAPVPDRRLIVAYLSDGNLPTTHAARTTSGWRALLAETREMHGRLAAYAYRMEIGPRVVAANSAHLDTVTGPSWLAVGDAALSFDPLSSQGILTALTAGLEAAEAIGAHLRSESGALDRYAARIRRIYAEYLRNRAAYYGMERRWPASPFWRRRHMLPAAP